MINRMASLIGGIQDGVAPKVSLFLVKTKTRYRDKYGKTNVFVTGIVPAAMRDFLIVV